MLSGVFFFPGSSHQAPQDFPFPHVCRQQSPVRVPGIIPLQAINSETPKYNGISVPARPPLPSTRGSWASSPRAALGQHSPTLGPSPQHAGPGLDPNPSAGFQTPRAAPAPGQEEGLAAGGKRMGGWKQTPLPPNLPSSLWPRWLLPPVGCGACRARVAAAPRMLAGVRTGPGVQKRRDAPMSQPSAGLAGHESTAVLLQSRRSAVPWLQPRLGLLTSAAPANAPPRGTPRAGFGAMSLACTPSPRRPIALVPLQRSPVQNDAFSPPGRPETLRHSGGWVGGLPSPAGDSPATGTIIG